MLAAGRADWHCPLTVVLKSENLLRMREIPKRFIVLKGNESYTFFWLEVWNVDASQHVLTSIDYTVPSGKDNWSLRPLKIGSIDLNEL